MPWHTDKQARKGLVGLLKPYAPVGDQGGVTYRITLGGKARGTNPGFPSSDAGKGDHLQTPRLVEVRGSQRHGSVKSASGDADHASSTF